jgi:hypothetical protein
METLVMKGSQPNPAKRLNIHEAFRRRSHQNESFYSNRERRFSHNGTPDVSGLLWVFAAAQTSGRGFQDVLRQENDG